VETAGEIPQHAVSQDNRTGLYYKHSPPRLAHHFAACNTALRRAGLRAGRSGRHDRGFVTITHAAGISSTGDAALDARLPLDQPYSIPGPTPPAIDLTRATGGRIIAIGTTVVRALEHAARGGSVTPGDGLATQRIDSRSRLRVVDVILSGTHEPASSHYELLRAFQDYATLWRMTSELESHEYPNHEFGDSVLMENRSRSPTRYQYSLSPNCTFLPGSAAVMEPKPAVVTLDPGSS